MQDELVQVAYAPAAYYLPLRARYAACTPDEQRCLNVWLMAHRRLPPPCGAALDRLGQRVLRNWAALPQVAMLMAAAQWRRRLLCEPAALALPGMLHHFLHLHPHADQSARQPGVQPDGGMANPEFLQQWGGAVLAASAHGLPRWLQARLPLLLPGTAPSLATAAVSPSPDLLWSALRHVEAFS